MMTMYPMNCLNGLINDKPFMPWASPEQQSTALMELVELDGERLGPGERKLVLDYAETVRDSHSIMDLIFELSESSYELQCGSVDPVMREYIQREIAAAEADEPEIMAV